MKQFIKDRLIESLKNILESSIIRIEKISPNADEITENLVYPYAKTLFTGINKIKRGLIENLTPQEKDYISSLFPNMLKIKTKEDFKTFSNIVHDPLIPHNLKNIYQLNRIDGKKNKVSIAFYYENEKTDEKTYAVVLNDTTIALNVASFGLLYLNELKKYIRHELVHLADPKYTDDELYSRIMNKDVNNNTVYYKLLHEFDAWSHQMISTIEENFNEISEPEYKAYMQKNIWLLVNDLKNNEYSTTYHNFKDNIVIRLFTTNGLKTKNVRVILKNFMIYLNAIDAWKTKPTLLKTFYKRLARVVPYK
jgi:hypothetical protein